MDVNNVVTHREGTLHWSDVRWCIEMDSRYTIWTLL